MTKPSFLLFQALCLSATLLTACAHDEPAPERAPEISSLGTITLVPAESPKTIRVARRVEPTNLAGDASADAAANKQRDAEFDAAHAEFRRQMGPKLTRALQQALVAQGYAVKLADPKLVERNDHNNLIPGRFAGHEAVLDVQIDDIGISGRHRQPYHLPMIDVFASLYSPSASKPVFDQGYTYGAGANKRNPGDVIADPKYASPEADALMGQPALVEQAFDEGLRLLVNNIVQDLRRRFAPKAAPAHAVDREAVTATSSAAPATPSTSASGKPKKTKAKKAAKTAKAAPAAQ